MTVKVLILEDNPVARSFLCRVVRESFSDSITITEAGDLESARRHISLTGGSQSSNASGIATVGSWTLGAVAGANSLTATVGAIRSPSPAT